MSRHGVVARQLRRQGSTSTASLEKANPSLLLHRLWLGAEHEREVEHLELVRTATAAIPRELIDALHTRREAAAAALPVPSRRVRIEPMWRLVVGRGEAGTVESGLTMSNTYGLPIIPGSALKGACAAQARRAGLAAADVLQYFGSAAAGRGSVRFYDALPVTRPHLVLDVLTPHVKPYYDQANAGREITQPPAEYHNPVPVRFLAVERTPFRTLLIGPPADTEAVMALLRAAADEWGLGGKTSAGYGYCEVGDE